MSSKVRVEIGRVTRLWLSRPEKYNALTLEMGEAIASAVEQLNANTAVRVVLVQAEGRAFCAGGDFSLIEAAMDRSVEDNQRIMRGFYESCLSLLRIRVPSIAVLHGAALGAGLGLALACDIRIASREAPLGANFVRVGLHPGMGCSSLLPRLIGVGRANELLLTGRTITGMEAAEIGLVHAAVPRHELRRHVETTVVEILSAAPLALERTKATLLEPIFESLDRVLEREALAQAHDFATADVRESVAAFASKRQPVYRGS